MKIYLDVCCLNRPFDDQMQDRIHLEVGLKPLDALHVACAEKAKAEVFLTTDDNLLSKAVQNKRMLKVKAENPLRWVMEVLK